MWSVLKAKLSLPCEPYDDWLNGCLNVFEMYVAGTSFGWPTGIRGTFSTTISLRTSSTSSPSSWSKPFIQEMAEILVTLVTNSFQQVYGVFNLILLILTFKSAIQVGHWTKWSLKPFFVHSCVADNFCTPPSRSFGPQFFFRCSFSFQQVLNVSTIWLQLTFGLYWIWHLLLHVKRTITNIVMTFLRRHLECLFWAFLTSRTGWTDTGCPTENSSAGWDSLILQVLPCFKYREGNFVTR